MEKLSIELFVCMTNLLLLLLLALCNRDHRRLNVSVVSFDFCNKHRTIENSNTFDKSFFGGHSVDRISIIVIVRFVQIVCCFFVFGSLLHYNHVCFVCAQFCSCRYYFLLLCQFERSTLLLRPTKYCLNCILAVLFLRGLAYLV